MPPRASRQSRRPHFVNFFSTSQHREIENFQIFSHHGGF
jgi:hypothetical protein